MKFILLPLLCESVSCPALFTSTKAVPLIWYEISTYLHQLQSLSVV